jgi:hypothetical protein
VVRPSCWNCLGYLTGACNNNNNTRWCVRVCVCQGGEDRW